MIKQLKRYCAYMPCGICGFFFMLLARKMTGFPECPYFGSRRLKEELERAGKTVVYFEYSGDDHNIGRNSATAWQRTIRFFNDNL